MNDQEVSSAKDRKGIEVKNIEGTAEIRPLILVDLAGSPIEEQHKAALYFLSHIEDMDFTVLVEIAKTILKELTHRGLGEPGLEAPSP